jgi:hypothetical protein
MIPIENNVPPPIAIKDEPQSHQIPSKLLSNTPDHLPSRIPESDLSANLDNNIVDKNITEDGIKIFVAGKYTQEFKKKVVDLARLLNNNSKAARDTNLKYGLSLTESSLRDWRKEIDNHLDVKAKKKKQIRDPVCTYPQMEESLMKWFLEKRKEKMAVNFADFKKKALELNKHPNFTASFGWFANFRRRHRITKRIPSHVIQKLHENTMNNIKDFLAEIRIYRSGIEESKKIREKKAVIFCNIDETAVQLNLDRQGTYELIGSREVLVNGTTNSKKRLTFLLGVLSTGAILPPLIILQSRQLVPNTLRRKYKDKALIFSSPSGWINEEILLKWLKYIWQSLKFAEEDQPVIILDKCPVHTKKTVIDYMNNREIKHFFIPAGCTGYLQPLDVSINKPFKDRVRLFLKDWIEEKSLNPRNITNQANIKPPTNDEIIEWALSSLSDIDDAIVKKSFKTCGILLNIYNYLTTINLGLTLNLDGSDYEKLNSRIKDHDEIRSHLKSIIGTPKRHLFPYDDAREIIEFQKQNEDHVTYEIQNQFEENQNDLLMLDNEIEVSSEEEFDQILEAAHKQEIDSDDDIDFEVKIEKKLDISQNKSNIFYSYEYFILGNMIINYADDNKGNLLSMKLEYSSDEETKQVAKKKKIGEKDNNQSQITSFFGRK